jgi:hypothetical protein
MPYLNRKLGRIIQNEDDIFNMYALSGYNINRLKEIIETKKQQLKTFFSQSSD